MFLSRCRSIICFIAILSLSGCDTCELPRETLDISKVAGIYSPTQETISILSGLGFDRTPIIEISRTGDVAMSNMPSIWQDWSGNHSPNYEDVAGSVDPLPVEPGSLFTLEIAAINGVVKPSTFAGSQLCYSNGSYRIEIPYQGWDQGAFLVFVQGET